MQRHNVIIALCIDVGSVLYQDFSDLTSVCRHRSTQRRIAILARGVDVGSVLYQDFGRLTSV